MVPHPQREPIAIIGMACRLPGGAGDPERFWALLQRGTDAIREIPAERGDPRIFFNSGGDSAEGSKVRWGGFVDGIDTFDPEFFGISLREAPCVDPQQRMLLEAAWEALEDGGQVLDERHAATTGVFIGISTNDYQQLQANMYDHSLLDVHTILGTSLSIAANRISYCLDVHGPSIALDTACSSSLVAVHLACRSLWSGESTLALAGGVNALLSPGGFVLSMLSPDGRCKAFDARANGFVRAEGVGIALLKPLSAAVADGNPIYAVIRGTAVNSDGRTPGITVPNPASQQALIAEACRAADVRPSDIYYVEAHGTGTAVGDPIEAYALGTTLGAGRPSSQPCIVGSVKTNIGHLEAGAGIAGLIKVAMMMQHRRIPPNLHFVEPNPRIDLDGLRLRVPVAVEDMPSGRLFAGINSFGFGGVNAHAVLESWSEDEAVRGGQAESGDEAEPCWHLLPLSARSAEALREMARRYAAFLAGDGNGSSPPRLRDTCYTAALHRKHHDHRVALVGRSAEELAERLRAFADGQDAPGAAAGVVQPRRRLVFVFGGQGAQWPGMARRLLREEPVFRDALVECDRLLIRHAGWSVLEELSADEPHSRLQTTSIAQPAIFCVQVALAALWKSWGVVPDAVVGHSVGEVAAAYVSRALDLETAVQVIFHRGRCMDLAPAAGRMLAAALPMADAADLVATTSGAVALAAVNSPSSVTLTGDPEVLAGIARALQERSTFSRVLNVEYAFHSSHMDPAREELLTSLREVTTSKPRIKMWSTVTGSPVGDDPLDADYWWRNVRNPVLFADAVAGLVADGHSVFLELSPHPVLLGSIAESFRHAGVTGTLAASMRREEDERLTTLHALARLYAAGWTPTPGWPHLQPGEARCVRLPRYPWQRQRYWQETTDIAEARQRPPEHPLLGRSFTSAHPHWEKQLGQDALTLFADHMVQGRIVLPAAAFIEMALAAGQRLFGDTGCVLEDLEIQKPLFLSEAGALPRLQFTFDPQQQEFSISSLASQAQRFWIVHCVGRLLPAQAGSGSPEWREALTSADHTVSGDQLYAALGQLGFQYGPAFRLARTVQCGEVAAAADVHRPPSWDDDDYQVHPAFLDACFHAVLGLAAGVGQNRQMPRYLPARFRRIRLYHRPGGTSRSQVRLVQRSEKFMEVDLRVVGDDGTTSLEIDGFTMLALEGGRSTGQDTIDRSLYDLEWQVQPLPGSQAPVAPPDFLPDPREMAPGLRQTVARLAERGWLPRFRELEKDIDHLCACYLRSAFDQLGAWRPPGEALDVQALRARVTPQHHHVLARHLDLLAREGLLEQAGGDWTIVQPAGIADPAALWRDLLRRFPAYLPELTGIEAFGRHLPDILSGDADTLGVLFAETSFIDQFYADSVTFRDYYALIQRVMDDVVARLPEGRTLRVLELGAGTGGLTASLLSHLPAARTEYVFTDISPLFLAKAEQRFRRHPWIRYNVLDLERDPARQGFEGQQFDVVLASEVLHATPDLRQTLRHVMRLLAPGGLFVALELDTPPRWVDLVFALTKGWWSFSDRELRPTSPLLSNRQWVALLEEEGFASASAIAEPDAARAPIQALLLAKGRGAGHRVDVEPVVDPLEANGNWLIFADEHGVAETLATHLAERGGTCTLVSPGDDFEQRSETRVRVRPAAAIDLARVLETTTLDAGSLRGIVFLWALDAPGSGEPTVAELATAQRRGSTTVLTLVQQLEALPRSAPLWLVTRGTQPAGRDGCRAVTHAPIWGLARVVMNEHPRLRCRLVDLAWHPGDREVSSLAAELLSAGGEEEVALRGSLRYVPRLVPARITAPAVLSHGTAVPYRLEITRPGVLDDLRLRPLERRPPGDGEVEIEVEAASLNFRDVMKALGIYPRELEDSSMLGDECAGRVVAVGRGVTQFRVGDHVTAFASCCLASHVTTSADNVLPTPTGLTPEDAVTIPVAFITACFTLDRLAQLQAGERVLIHSAAGGVGLAALQVARLARAEVFATAGSPRKRALLRAMGVRHVLDSRSLTFADEIMRITEGRGVDVVLNSLAGEALTKSMSVLGVNGRFLEIGKRDVFQNSKIGLRQFRNSLSFHLFDLVTAVPTQGERIRAIRRQVNHDLEAGRLSPLPTRVFPMGDVGEGFRHMMEAGHVGKIVFRLDDQPVRIEPEIDSPAPLFRDNATYLITGGFGGFSLAIAGWMVEQGARHLVLVGRQGAATPEARQAVDQLRLRAQVVEARADVADEDGLEALLRRIDDAMPPLAGVVHAAMVLDDGVVLQLSEQRLERVTTPKILGAWNLHRLTLQRSLDFFIMCSSFTSMTGNPGQGNYAAANAFLDSLAHYRRSRGLPGLCVNWGSIKDVGYIARTAHLGDTLSRLGVQGISVDHAMQILGRLIRSDAAQIGVMSIDWPQLVEYIASLKTIRRFSLVLASSSDGRETATSAGQLRDRLMHQTAEERRATLLAFLREHAAKVLRTTPAAIDTERALADLGLDSLMAVELSNRLEGELGVALPMGKLTAGESLARLVDLLMDVLHSARAAAATA